MNILGTQGTQKHTQEIHVSGLLFAKEWGSEPSLGGSLQSRRQSGPRAADIFKDRTGWLGTNRFQRNRYKENESCKHQGLLGMSSFARPFAFKKCIIQISQELCNERLTDLISRIPDCKLIGANWWLFRCSLAICGS